MTSAIAGPFFEIGPKNYLRRAELEALVRAAGLAGAEFGVAVVLTVPTAMIAPIANLGAGVFVFAQGMDVDEPGPSVCRVTAESLVDAGAVGVMLNHDSNPLTPDALALSVGRARATDLATMVCTATTPEAVTAAQLDPTIVLYEPPALIGKSSDGPRGWIAGADLAVKTTHPAVLMMHAGGVSSPAIARSIMAAGADGTGSTSGVLMAADPLRAAREFIESVRAGWDEAYLASQSLPLHQHQKGESA
jgi:triosephosphate isomerase